ncbi:MAG: D-alanine--D-alanine ligase [Bacteroidota bacterium]|nr:D-alanine--D-alanine ligase [Bacteroidota bacterium]MDX5430163.1 D-alanine--D-alanine ligase [Bacteroidota bacterium]MDX5468928.1 D-alanine--D-alanine ligase [Bacteroidota bacterium]
MIRVAILFGGSSREREVSFSGGRTVYDNLDKSRFEAIPIFVDSFNQLTVLDWSYVYKGSIRDFYPPIEYLPDSPNAYQIYAESLDPAWSYEMRSKIGKPIQIEDLKGLCDLVFLALHGKHAEDGSIQGLLDWLEIPYTGSGVFASAFGIHKRIQKELFTQSQWSNPQWMSFSREAWLSHADKYLDELVQRDFPLVIKAATQGSSIGISVVSQPDKKELIRAVNKAFFRVLLEKESWTQLTPSEQVEWVRETCDIREGLGLPLLLNNEVFTLPENLLERLRARFDSGDDFVWLEALDGESEVVVESFIEGREISCIVIQQEDGTPLALPPTEIVKGKEVFDYRSKYLPGLSRKLTPISLPNEEIQRIRKACESLFKQFSFNVYARIDGFYGPKGEIYLNDPNTTSGMMPSSFFFHQAAEIGLSPSDFLSYIIETSLKERIRHNSKPHAYRALLNRLKVESGKASDTTQKIRVAVIMGGYSTERHISVESGRNIFEKLSSSVKYDPFPVFLTGSDEAYEMHLLPINMMLKDNADDIREKVLHYELHPILAQIQEETEAIRSAFKSNSAVLKPQRIGFEELAERCDEVFIALHGRPGEDGSFQVELEKVGLPYNGSGTASSSITINKYETNRKLEKAGFLVAKAVLVEEADWLVNHEGVLQKIQSECGFPLIAKPADDGCSSAVKKIDNQKELEAFAKLIFRKQPDLDTHSASLLQIDPKEEIPQKSYFLVEELIDRKGADHFLEITGGLLTHRNPDGSIRYEIFEASESLAEKGILSLAEKFLAGQGQNITPARYAKEPNKRQLLSDQVKATFEAAARLLEIEGYARIDAFVRIFGEKVEVIFIEVNSLPGMTPATCIFHQTAINGYPPLSFIDHILEDGRSRNASFNERT